jgi:predicted nucleic acid-binding protein
MRTVFADTFYWVALINPRDEWHERAIETSRALGSVRIVTTDEVLSEVLTFLSGAGPYWRAAAVATIRAIMNSPSIQVIPQTRDSFLAGLELYASRPDKEYSLTDCASMQTLRRMGLAEILTHDLHFRQEGFTLLLGDRS